MLQRKRKTQHCLHHQQALSFMIVISMDEITLKYTSNRKEAAEKLFQTFDLCVT